VWRGGARSAAVDIFVPHAHTAPSLPLGMTQLVAVFRRRAEHRTVLQLAEEVVEPYVRLQGQPLRVFVADRTQTLAHFTDGNERAAEAAG
jgi:hypothetical protein